MATVARQCCRPIGRSCDGESRDVAPAAGCDAPTRSRSPSARFFRPPVDDSNQRARSSPTSGSLNAVSPGTPRLGNVLGPARSPAEFRRGSAAAISSKEQRQVPRARPANRRRLSLKGSWSEAAGGAGRSGRAQRPPTWAVSGSHGGQLVAMELAEVVGHQQKSPLGRTLTLPLRWKLLTPQLCLVWPNSGSTPQLCLVWPNSGSTVCLRFR